MHNSYVRTGGFWGAFTPVTHVEFAQFDLAQFQSLNADLGGTWAPASAIVIGGHGLHLTTAFTADTDSTFGTGGFNTVTFNASVLFNASVTTASLTITGAWTSQFEAFLNGVTQIGVTAGDTLNVNAVATFSALVHCTGTTSLAGSNSISGPTAISGNVALSAPVTTAGAGSFVGRYVPIVVNAAGAIGQTASPLTGNFYFFPSAAAGSTIQISATGAVVGDRIIFKTMETTNGITIKDPGGSTIVAILKSGGSLHRAEVTMVSAGVWVLTGYELS